MGLIWFEFASNFGDVAGLVWVSFCWVFFGHLWVLFGSDFGDIVGLVWFRFCWVLLVICGFFFFGGGG